MKTLLCTTLTTIALMTSGAHLSAHDYLTTGRYRAGQSFTGYNAGGMNPNLYAPQGGVPFGNPYGQPNNLLYGQQYQSGTDFGPTFGTGGFIHPGGGSLLRGGRNTGLPNWNPGFRYGYYQGPCVTIGNQVYCRPGGNYRIYDPWTPRLGW